MSEQTLSPEVIKAAHKELAKREKRKIKAQKNAEQHDFVVKDTIEFNDEKNRFSVEVECPVTGEHHRLFTQDLKQTRGLSKAAKAESDKVDKAEKKELLARAMEAIKNGDVS